MSTTYVKNNSSANPTQIDRMTVGSPDKGAGDCRSPFRKLADASPFSLSAASPTRLLHQISSTTSKLRHLALNSSTFSTPIKISNFDDVSSHDGVSPSDSSNEHQSHHDVSSSGSTECDDVFSLIQSRTKSPKNSETGSGEPTKEPLPLLDLLPDGVYASITDYLEIDDLLSLELTNKACRELNANLNIWQALGRDVFKGIEILEETFDGFATENSERYRQGDSAFWKHRLHDWRIRVLQFGGEPAQALVNQNQFRQADEVCYLRCRIRATDMQPGRGIFIDVQVTNNADNLSIAVVDFDEGGKSSVTFSPDTGAVIKETKVQESPRRVQGWYVQPLHHVVSPTAQAAGQPFNPFRGHVGIYVKDQRIAFFRKCFGDAEWECTGYVVGLEWAAGSKLTPCIAFRDEGTYQVCVRSFSHEPPFEPVERDDPRKTKNWQELNWEGNDDRNGAPAVYYGDAHDDAPLEAVHFGDEGPV